MNLDRGPDPDRPTRPRSVRTASTAPADNRSHDAVLFDLDGVVYLQDSPIPFAVDGIAAVRAAGLRVGFVTNNASRRPEEVAAFLCALGVDAVAAEVVTSAQAAAQLLAERLPAGAPVLVVGAPALVDEVAEAGLDPVCSADSRPLAVVQGYGVEVGWRQLAEACVALHHGAWWVATNGDTTLPSGRGPLPGNGALVSAVATAVGRPPDEVVGKPHPRLYRESWRRIGASAPLVVGDRLDTDIEGAVRAGIDSLLVLTGVTTPWQLLLAPEHARPTFVADDLRGLFEPPPPVTGTGPVRRCQGWTATIAGGRLVLAGTGAPVDALRVLAVGWWESGLAAGQPITAEGEPARWALTRWGLNVPASVVTGASAT